MTRPIEARLRHALQGAAEEITDHTLTDRRPFEQLLADELRLSDTSAEPHRIGLPEQVLGAAVPLQARTSHRWTMPLLAAAAVVAVAVGTSVTIGIVRAQRQDQSGRPTPSPTASLAPAPTSSSTSTTPRPSTSTSPAPTGLLARGQQRPVSSLDWGTVGAGWTVAGWASDEQLTPPLLFIVNPIGGRYLVGPLPVGYSITAVSPDHRRVLATSTPPSGVATFAEIDLATNRVVHRFTAVAPATAFVAYTHPTGTAALFATAGPDGTSTLVKRDLEGSLQTTYPSVSPVVGALAGGYVYAADGSRFAEGAAHGSALLSNGGTLLAEFPPPPGYARCLPLSWWDAATLQLACTSAKTSVQQVFLQPAGGGTPTPLTSAGADDRGHRAVLRYPGGTVLEDQTGCAGGPLELEVATTPTPLRPRLPSGTPIDVMVVLARSGTSLVGRAAGCGSDYNGAPLFAYDPTTGTSQALLGAGVNGGTVTDALPFVAP